jgi:glyoxylase-like metal-dependent hydrolase (beta-lactamase superfamily II)
MKRGLLSTCLALIALIPILQAQQPQAEIKLTPVAGRVYLLQGEGAGNVGAMADPAGVILIDSMFQRSAPSIRKAIQSLPGGDKVRFLINTHWHSDHADGNLAFGPGSIIIAHENVRALLSKPQALQGQQSSTYPAGALPSVTYSSSMTLYAGDEEVLAIERSSYETLFVVPWTSRYSSIGRKLVHNPTNNFYRRLL